MKDIFKTAIEKTKKIMTNIISFLTKKRFSIITSIIMLTVLVNMYSCVSRPKVREPTTALADYIEPTSSSDLYVVQTLGNVQFVSNAKSLYYVWSPIITFTCDNLSTDSIYINISYPTQDGSLDWFHIESSPYLADGIYNTEGVVSSYAYLIGSYNNNNRVRGYLSIEYATYVEEEINAYLPFYDVRSVSSNILIGTGNGNVNLTLYCHFKPDGSSTEYSLNAFDTTLLDSRSFDISELTQRAYASGREYGFQKGYQEGLDSVFEDVSPFEMISSSISSILDIEILPNFKLSNILLIAFGFIMLAVILRFLHG